MHCFFELLIVLMYSHRAGKTVFLLYLLLYRLERRLPTAIHLWSNHLVVFNDEGATIRTVDDLIPMTSDYWALSDSNQIIKEPCPALRRSTARIIQASSPRPDRCKDWLKYCKARIVVTDLPSPFEIGAITYVIGFHTPPASVCLLIMHAGRSCR